MKACFLANVYFFLKKFSLDLEVAQENSSKTAGKTRLPAASRIFLANQRERLKVNEVGCEESRHFSSFGFIMADLVKFSLCFGPGKVSL